MSGRVDAAPHRRIVRSVHALVAFTASGTTAQRRSLEAQQGARQRGWHAAPHDARSAAPNHSRAPTFSTVMSPAPPRPGYMYAATCMGEALCAEGPWVARGTTPAFRGAGDRTHVAFRLRPHQRVHGLRGRYVITQPGVAVFDAARAPFAAGDTVYVLGYLGEGYHTLWHRGVLREDAPDGPGVRWLRPARAVWWLEVRDVTGARGWVPLPERGTTTPLPLMPAGR